MMRMRIFVFGFLQVFFVSAQTWFVARSFWPGVAAGGFMISFLWTLNVKSMAFGGWIDRTVYAGGAMLGALFGLAFGKVIL